MLRAVSPPHAVPARRGRSTRWTWLVVAWQIVVVVVLALALQRQWWSTVSAALVVLVAVLLSIPVNGRTLLGLLGTRRRFAARARLRLRPTDVPAELAPLARWLPELQVTEIKDAHDDVIGVVADGRCWSGVLEVVSDTTPFTDRGARLDLNVLGSLTRQDDIVFSGIQVATFTVPGPCAAMLPPDSPALAAYREIAGAAAPPSIRRTWIVLRLDPRLCLEAVDRRGSGQAGIFATLRFGLHRAQATLKRHGMATTPLDPRGIADVLALTSGASDQPEADPGREEWEHLVCDSLIHRTRPITGFDAAPSARYQALLDAVAQCPAMFAVTSFTVAPGEPSRGAVRLVTANTEQAVAADEFLIRAVASDLRLGPLGGLQVPGLLATVALGRQVDR